MATNNNNGETKMIEERSNLEIRQALYKFSRSDLRLAEKQGDVIVTATKRGNLLVSYDAATKRYAISTMGLHAEELCKNLTKAEAVPALADYYQIS
jgi:hypothetical protein